MGAAFVPSLTTDLADVAATAPADGQVFTWVASTARWTPVASPAAPVASVFGRTGAILAQAGDYTAAQVTGAVSTAGSYADPAWITALAGAKIAGNIAGNAATATTAAALATTLTTGRVLYGAGTGVPATDAKLTYATNILGVQSDGTNNCIEARDSSTNAPRGWFDKLGNVVVSYGSGLSNTLTFPTVQIKNTTLTGFAHLELAGLAAGSVALTGGFFADPGGALVTGAGIGIRALTNHALGLLTNNTLRILISNAGLVTVWDGGNLALGTTTGTQLGTVATQKLGLWGATPIVRPSATGQTAGFTAGAGSAVDSAATFTGGVGATAYTIGDLVRHLKNIGLIAP